MCSGSSLFFASEIRDMEQTVSSSVKCIMNNKDQHQARFLLHTTHLKGMLLHTLHILKINPGRQKKMAVVVKVQTETTDDRICRSMVASHWAAAHFDCLYFLMCAAIELEISTFLLFCPKYSTNSPSGPTRYMMMV